MRSPSHSTGKPPPWGFCARGNALGGCCTTAMEPRSPPPLWPVSNAFSTPWTPHPVDGPARRAATSFPSRRKGHVLGQPPPIVGPSTQPLDHANGLPTGPFQFDLHEGARLLTRHRVTGT